MSRMPQTPYTKLSTEVKATIVAKLKKKFVDAATGKSPVRKVEYSRKDIPRALSLADKNEPLIVTAYGKDGKPVGRLRVYEQRQRLLFSASV